MRQWFHITELRFQGSGMPDAIVRFQSGLSVVSGPSDTGKSLVRDAINHVLGSGEAMRDIEERERYGRILVEVCSQDGQIATLERSWNGGDIFAHNCRVSTLDMGTPGRHLAAKHDANSVDTISAFLLGLCGLTDKRLRTNKRGETRTLSFRDLVKLTLVPEERIISKESMIHSGSRTDRTVESSLLRMLLTNTDDATLIPSMKPELVRAEGRGRKDTFAYLRANVMDRIAALGTSETQLLQEAEDIDKEVDATTDLLRTTTAGTANYEQRRAQLWKTRQPIAARQEHVRSMLARFTLLQKKYASDIERLFSAQETGVLLGNLDEGPCPLCGAPPEDHKHDVLLGQEQIQSFADACSAEIEKILAMQEDLRLTIDRLLTEQTELDREIGVLESEMREVDESLRSVIQPKVTALRTDLSRLIDTRRRIDVSLALFAELRHLDESELQYQTIVQPTVSKEPSVFATTPVNILEALSETVEDVLEAWEYPGLTRVVFDSAKDDLIVCGKAKSDFGKGYRAIINSAFSVALMILCREKGLPHPGFVVLDSPLVTYREPDEDIGENLKKEFYKHLSTLGPDMQVIVLENIDPPDEILSRIAYTHFSKNSSVGRYGLLLPPDDNAV